MRSPSFHLDIVSAEAEIFSGLVEKLFVSGIMGDLEILNGHAPLLTHLQAAPVTIIKANGTKEVFYISGGMLEVQPKATTILADTAFHAKDLSETKALEAKKRAEEVLAGHRKDLDFAEAELELIKAIAQLDVLKKIRQKGKN
jgi:F-type H+-transporting ATPase subunit epsilon